MDDRDVGVIEGRERSCLALEAGQPIVVARERLGKDLDGDEPIELRVPRTIDLAHSAGSDCGEDFVWPEARADGQRHGAMLILPTEPPTTKEGSGPTPSAPHPAPPQKLPADQPTPEREERFVDVGPFVIPHAQAPKLTDPGKCA